MSMKKDPEECTEDGRQAMRFLYQVIIPKVTATYKQGQVWVGGNTYFKILGNKWAHSMATCFILYKYYTNTDNIVRNSKILRDKTGDGNIGTDNEPPKKRARSMPHSERMNLHDKYFAYMRTFNALAGEEGTEEMMERWDKLYNPLANKMDKGASSRDNICPKDKQGPGGLAPGSEDEQKSEWDLFCAEIQQENEEVEKGLRPMPPLTGAGAF